MSEIILNPKVDEYMAIGCGRCPLVATPKCKVMTWQEPLQMLRTYVLESGLVEEHKWSQPVYMSGGKNVLLIGAFKDFCIISFFKGALMKDESGVLTQPGENSHSWRWIRFTDVRDVVAMEATIKAYIQEAVEIEKAGLKINYPKPSEMDFPEELLNKFEDDPDFEAAFYKLTPGRQKGYLLHFSQAKQSATRAARIEKFVSHIFAGKGFQD